MTDTQRMKTLSQTVRVMIRWTAGLLIGAVLGTATSVWAQGVGAGSTPPREEWTRIFEKNFQNSDEARADAERETWSTEMYRAYRRWKHALAEDVDRRLAETTKRLEESKPLAEKADQARLIRAILEHHVQSPQDIAQRANLVQRLRQQTGLINHAPLAEFVRDYIAGKPMTRAHLLAIQMWANTL